MMDIKLNIGNTSQYNGLNNENASQIAGLNIGNTSQISDDEAKINTIISSEVVTDPSPRDITIDNDEKLKAVCSKNCENSTTDAEKLQTSNTNSENDTNRNGQVHNDTPQLEDSTGSDTGPLLTNITIDPPGIVHIQGRSGDDPEHSANEPVIDKHATNSIRNINCSASKKKWTWIGLLFGVLTVVTIVVILTDHFLNKDRHPPQNNNTSTSYAAYAVYNNSIWSFKGGHPDQIRYEKKSDVFHIYQRGINIIHLEIQESKQKLIKAGHIRNSCIQSSGKDGWDNANHVCQRISSDLNIPFSVFLATQVKGEQRVRVVDYKPTAISSEDIVKSLVITSWPDTKILGLARFHLDKNKINHIRVNKGQLPWIKAEEYGKSSILYHSKWKLFDVTEPGIYLILLSMNTHVTSASNLSSIMVQTCLKSADNTCRRFVLKGGMSAPFNMIYINRLSTKDKIDITFNSILDIYNTGDTRTPNSLTIVRFPEDFDFSRYHLNTHRHLRTCETLRWKEHAMISKIFNLRHGIVFAARETGIYWIVVSLTIQTMSTENMSESIDDMSACIVFSEGQPYCQNIFIERGVVFPITLSTVRRIPSYQSFIITLKQPNLLYKSRVFNSLFVLKL